MHIIKRIGLGVAICTVAAVAQDWGSQVRALRPAGTSQAESSMLDNLDQRAKAALDAIPHARTAAEADKARPVLRRKLEKSLGYRNLPWPPALNAQTVGTIQRDGYHIEKIVYQSLPGVSVPAHFYLPDNAPGPLPAILFYTGHWYGEGKSKADFQAFCINMARLGFAVFTFDTFGQGERGVSNRDHRRTEGLVVGVSQQGFAEYETRCALEYLLSRKEIDKQRIGMTGASGGGYNTWMTAALDDRIKVAVPVVGTSDFYEQIHVARGFDWYHANEHCHFVPGLIKYANNHELATMIAPRPLMIISASQDQSFPVKGVREVAAYTKDLYKAYGVPEKAAYSEDSTTGHGYQQKKREAAYGFFLKWLGNKGEGRPYAEPATETPDPYSAELRCFPAGENRPSGPGMNEAIRQIAAKLPLPNARRDFETVFGPLPKAEPFKAKLSGDRVQRLEVATESGITVPAFLIRLGSAEKGFLIALDDRGKEEVANAPEVRKALADGWAVCGVDPRGIGELSTKSMGWVAAVSLLLNENFVWRQAWDVTRVMDYLSAAARKRPFAIYARGRNASLAATYVRMRRNVRVIALHDAYKSYREFIDKPDMKESFALKTDPEFRTAKWDDEIPFEYFAFDALRYFDLEDAQKR